MNDTSHTSFALLDRPPPSATDGSRACADSLATAVSRELSAAGLPITPERATRFADALILMGPVSRRRVYFTARTVFVSDPDQLPAFEQAIASVLGVGST